MKRLNTSWKIPTRNQGILYSKTCLERPLPCGHLCFKRPHTLAEGTTFQYNWTCHQRPPDLLHQIFMSNGWSFKKGSTVYECIPHIKQERKFMTTGDINQGTDVKPCTTILIQPQNFTKEWHHINVSTIYMSGVCVLGVGGTIGSF